MIGALERAALFLSGEELPYEDNDDGTDLAVADAAALRALKDALEAWIAEADPICLYFAKDEWGDDEEPAPVTGCKCGPCRLASLLREDPKT